MGCDYYTQISIHIEYIDDTTGELQKKVICNPVSNGYIYLPDYEILNNTYEMIFNNFEIELNRKILRNTYIKKLYEHEHWVSDEYKNQYGYILTNNDGLRIIQIYENSNAWKRT